MKKLIVLVCLTLVTLVTCVYKKIGPSGHESRISLAVDNKIKTFDPAIAFNDDSLLVIGQSLETLYQYHYLKRPYEVIPLLAEGMPKITNEGKTYTIKIKKGIPYHSQLDSDLKGREVIAQDFVNQIKRLSFKPIKSTGKWLFRDKIVGFAEFGEEVGDNEDLFYSKTVSGLKVIDDYTLEINLKRPEPNLLYFLSMPFTAPVPLKTLKKHNNRLDAVIVGTGAYEFFGFNNDAYKFKKYSKFHPELYPSSGDRFANTEDLLSSSKEALPFIEELQFKVISDDDKKWEAFKKGDVDILDVPKKYLKDLSDTQSKEYQELRDLEVSVKHSSRQATRWLGFNMNDPVVGKNLNLRKAIAYAIDFESYIHYRTNNTSLRAGSIINPTIPGYNPRHKVPYSFNLEKAKGFLKEAGYAPGQLTLRYSTRGSQKTHMEEAEFLKSQLGKIGVNLDIETLEFAHFLKRGRNGELQFWTDNWIYDYPDAENIIQLLVSKNHPGINKSGYFNPEVDILYEELARASSKDARFEIMYRVEEILEKELPWILLIYESTYIVHHGHIKNFRKSFFIRNYIKYIQK